jgi:hypothetical protein
MTQKLHACARARAHLRAGCVLTTAPRRRVWLQHGWTPLHWAVMRRHAGVVRLLGEAGADVDAANDVRARALLLLLCARACIRHACCVRACAVCTCVRRC